MLEAGQRDVFVYRFDWDEAPSNWLLDLKSLLGAGHSFEIPFVFHDIDGEMTYMPMALIDEGNLPGAEPLARSMSAYWGQFAHSGDPGNGDGTHPHWKPSREKGRYLVLDSEDDGGIRMRDGALDRSAVFDLLANGAPALGGEQGLCLAYNNLFGKDAIFSFTTACAGGEDCAGAPQRFCP